MLETKKDDEQGTQKHQLNKETRASLRNDKKEWMGEIANELESAASKQDMRTMYQLKKKLINKPSKKATQVRDINGVIIKDEKACRRRWAEYFETLLNAEEPIELHDFSGHMPMDEIAIDMGATNCRESK